MAGIGSSSGPSGSGSGNVSVSASSTPNEETINPLWKYVTVKEKFGGGGNCRWVCNFCEGERQGPYTRVRCHLMKITGKGIGPCLKVKDTDIMEMIKLEDEAKERIEKKKPNEVSLPSGPSSSLRKARFVKEKIVDELWWDQVNYILAFTGPIYEMIRQCDTDKPRLHLVYEQWDSMIDKVKAEIYKHEQKEVSVRSSFFDVVHRILVARWGKAMSPLHCLAHSLNPRFYTDGWFLEDSKRVPPNRDEVLSEERMKCFRKLYPDDMQYDQVMGEYFEFSRSMGKFRNPESLTRRYTMDPNVWWANFGSTTPLLQSLAFKVLGQPTSSSCCERNWSTYSFVHSLRRNKLTPQQAEDLVFIHNNLRLLSRNSAEYKDERTKFWDLGGDTFGNLEDTGILEFANLSLDEPELENAFLTSNRGNVADEVIIDDD